MIPDSHKDLLENAYPATVGTTMPDGQPQLTVIWTLYEGDVIKFSTREPSQKVDNLKQRPQITLMIIDPENMYRYLEVRGRAAITQEGAIDLIDRLAQKYMGRGYYDNMDPDRAQADRDQRVVVTIKPEHVVANG
ncbi:MAG: PPOX class F420-dependent oxidoreductase [Chloroflexi bacterium]|nr:PPOX class F420-dependent oxidoreductase [Chloroflexota bacterium]